MPIEICAAKTENSPNFRAFGCGAWRALRSEGEERELRFKPDHLQVVRET